MTSDKSAVTCSSILFQFIPERFAANPDLARQAHGIYEFRLSGPNGGVFYLNLNAMPPQVTTGEGGKSDVQVEMSDRDFVDFFQGRLNGTLAYFQGRIRVRGNLPLAMKMGRVISQL